ncbi:adenylate/guanylate cyclase [Rhodopirellula maiorica SM1]|uniref:Adenylate/guanylate cyclase n=1 Tax=Rhodopirellula maiorica SM1 TaxID=1265738 RepID=M5RQL5_9BACT|nr:adenylate/guanylate cyclase domain-containing protein [Rhodopirellula maiorica]EMI16244.1 adenylate/guanylate cyclase [Rhodopirellula maiorica SM1]
MADLIAQGPQEQQRWRRALPDATSGREIMLGRADSDWNVPWDPMISRRHTRIKVHLDHQIEIIQNVHARNPVFYRGRQSPQFKLTVGEHFVIGETTFTVVNRPGASELPSSENVTQHAYDYTVLRRRHFRDANSRIDMLSRLPDLITSAETDEELLVRMTNVLLQATPAATAVAVVALQDDSATDNRVRPRSDRPVQILHYDSRGFEYESAQVSARLARSAIETRESVLQVWSPHEATQSGFTTNEGVDWAFCVPLRSVACRGWAIYVTGQSSTHGRFDPRDQNATPPEALQDDLKFAELVGSMVANLRQTRRLERRQASMRQFFAPIVMDALANQDPADVLRPREAKLSVMFCDLRGFTQKSEEQSDHLLELLNQVSESLGVMTRAILDYGGVIGDFHGDAAMGFWGWPIAQSDNVVRAANAAIQIRRQLAIHSNTNNSEIGYHFQHGIGIATGNAVAGQIGTVDQVKVTAFGPVVNLASRLEGLTKQFGVQTIIDEPTAMSLQGRPDPEPSGDNGAAIVTRRLARVRPAGLIQPVNIYQLSLASETLDDADLATYQRGLEAFIEGDWTIAREAFACIAERDRPSQRILAQMARQGQSPPAGWLGVLDLEKS